jgi:hypothetical protein
MYALRSKLTTTRLYPCKATPSGVERDPIDRHKPAYRLGYLKFPALQVGAYVERPPRKAYTMEMRNEHEDSDN